MKTIITLIVVLVVAGAGYLIWDNQRTKDLAVEASPTVSPSPTASPEGTPTAAASPTKTPSPTATHQNAIVTYTDSGFSPKVTTIKTGATVTFRNQSSGMFWPASGPHPAHTAYDGTSLSLHCTNKTATTFDACVGIAASQTYSFKFTKIGTWNYHDHLHSSLTGSVIVQ